VSGKLQSEAIGINISLHFLERCIVVLQEKMALEAKGSKQAAQVYVPYR
jgi:hypothetical protein